MVTVVWFFGIEIEEKLGFWIFIEIILRLKGDIIFRRNVVSGKFCEVVFYIFFEGRLILFY